MFYGQRFLPESLGRFVFWSVVLFILDHPNLLLAACAHCSVASLKVNKMALGLTLWVKLPSSPGYLW